MRKPCYDCFLKHISKAAVTECETKLGYAEHLMYVIGNLSEAEDEIYGFSPELSNRTRDLRLKLMDDLNYNIVPECEELFQEGLALKLAAAVNKEAVLP